MIPSLVFEDRTISGCIAPWRTTYNSALLALARSVGIDMEGSFETFPSVRRNIGQSLWRDDQSIAQARAWDDISG